MHARIEVPKTLESREMRTCQCTEKLHAAVMTQKHRGVGNLLAKLAEGLSYKHNSGKWVSAEGKRSREEVETGPRCTHRQHTEIGS